jgi:hypothetical protein
VHNASIIQNHSRRTAYKTQSDCLPGNHHQASCWSHCIFQRYTTSLPTSLSCIALTNQKLLVMETGCGCSVRNINSRWRPQTHRGVQWMLEETTKKAGQLTHLVPVTAPLCWAVFHFFTWRAHALAYALMIGISVVRCPIEQMRSHCRGLPAPSPCLMQMNAASC